MQRLSELETALSKVNGGAGMGFVVLGFRMNPGMIKALASSAILVVPVLLFNYKSGSVLGDDVCSLTPAQVDTIQAAMSASDRACVYNVTLQSILA